MDKSGEIWQHCPATVSSISKPSLMEKLQQDATKFRGTCPLPSIMGDSIESGTIASETIASGTADTHCPEEGKSSQEEEDEDIIISDSDDDEEEKEEEKLDQKHDNPLKLPPKDHTKLSGLLQFDPSKTDHLKVVRTPSSTDESIFSMGDHETVALPKDSLGDSLKKMGESQDTLPPLVDDEEEQMTEAEEINSLFSATWSVGFSLTSDNALGHKDELEKNKRDSLLGEPGDEEDTEEESLGEFREKVKGKGETGQEDNASASSAESVSLAGSEAETDSFVEEDLQRTSNASQALLQFNHVSPDGLDFATCQRDDTSIFQMDSNSTMDVPAVNLESELDKKLKHVGNKARDKRGSLFGTKLLEKAKSFKRPKALMEKALTRAESFRVPATLLPSIDAKGKDTTTDNTTADDSANKTQSTSITSANTSSTQSDFEGREGSIPKDESTSKRLTENSMDKSNPRRRRERARRESVRDTQDGERKERQRKRDALRKAASSRNMGDGLSPKKRGSTRRRSTKTGDIGHNSVPHINTDLFGEGNNNETSPSSARRRSTRMGENFNNSVPYLETDWKRENNSKSSGRRRNAKSFDVGNSSIPHLDTDWKREGTNKTSSSSGRRRGKIDIGNSSVPHLDADPVGEGHNKTSSSSGRRRGSGNRDSGNSSVPHLDIDQSGEGNSKTSSTSGRRRSSRKTDPADADQSVEGKIPPSNDGKESRRRSTMRKSLSSRQLMPGRPSTTSASTSNSGGERRSVRRTLSSDDGKSGRRTSNRRRASERPSDSRRRSRSRDRKDKKDQGKTESRRSRSRARLDKNDLDRSHGQADEKSTKLRRSGERGESDLDRSSKRGDEKRRSDRRSVDAKRTSRASRHKTKENEGNENDMDKSKESQTGGRNRRRSSKDRKQMRRSRRSRGEKTSDTLDNGNNNSTDPNDDKEPPTLERGPSIRLNNSFTKMNVFGDDAKEGEAGLSSSPPTTNLFEFENDTKEEEFKPQTTSSLRTERSFDSSFSDLAAAREGIGGRLTETFHNDLGAGETDRRKSFIKSISVRISAKQTTLGKGARNLIIGGSKTEKQRLLDIDDESVISS